MSTGSSRGCPRWATHTLVQRLGEQGEVPLRLLLPRIRLRPQGQDLQPRSDGHAPQEVAEAPHRKNLKAASPRASSSML